MSNSPASKHRLYFLLQGTAHALKKHSDSELKTATNLTTSQAATLNLIVERMPVTQKNIAKALRQNESAMTAMVKRLEKMGYVVRSRAEDGRKWHLSSTAKGLEALAAGKPAFNQINNLLDMHFSEEAAANLCTALGSLLAQLDTRT